MISNNEKLVAALALGLSLTIAMAPATAATRSRKAQSEVALKKQLEDYSSSSTFKSAILKDDAKLIRWLLKMDGYKGKLHVSFVHGTASSAMIFSTRCNQSVGSKKECWASIEW